MDNAIMFTPHDFITAVLAVCGFLVAINGAALVLVGWYRKAHKPEDVQNERITILEKKVSELEAGRDQNIEDIKNLQRSTKDFQKIMIKSLQALSEHSLDSSAENTERLKHSVGELNDYLIENYS